MPPPRVAPAGLPRLLALALALVLVCVGALLLLAARRRSVLGGGLPAPPGGPEPEPGGPAPEPEAALREVFGLWGDASRAAARAALAGDRAPADQGPEAARLAGALGRLRARGLDFCPVTRRLAPFDPALDPGPVRPWLLYRPRAPAAAPPGGGAPRPPPPARRSYRLAVTAPGAPPETAALFAGFAPRRFEGAPARALLLRCGEGAAGAAEGPGLRARAEAVPAKGLPAALAALAAAGGEGPGSGRAPGPPDLVVVDFRPKGASGPGPVVLDPFVPAYPVELEPDVWVLTPIIAAQVAREAEGPAALRRALAARLGGVLRPGGLPRRGGADRSGRGARARAHARGRSDRSDRDRSGGGPPLITPVVPEAVRFVPRCAHGWLSEDTAVLLRAALRAARPEAYVELGAWLGSSAVAAARAARALGLPLAIYAVDFFQNAAASTGVRTRLGPVDKLLAVHPRFETFHANLADEVGGGVRAFSVRAEASAGARAVAPLAARGGRPAVVFVDCEKQRAPLLRLLRLVVKLFPGALVVGDDAVFATVRQALDDLRADPGGFGGRRVFETRTGYALVPPALAPAFEAALAEEAAPSRRGEAAAAGRGPEAAQLGEALAGARGATPDAAPSEAGMRGVVAAAARARAAEAAGGDPGPWRLELARKTPRLLADPRLFEAALGGNPADWPRLANDAAQTPFDYLTHHSSFRL